MENVKTAVALARADRINDSNNTSTGLMAHELKWFTKSMLFVIFCIENENVATVCRMMTMSMKKEEEEVHHHPSHIVVLPVHHHHQLLLQTDQAHLDISVTGGKCYKNSGISFPHFCSVFGRSCTSFCIKGPVFPKGFFLGVSLYPLGKCCLKICLRCLNFVTEEVLLKNNVTNDYESLY